MTEEKMIGWAQCDPKHIVRHHVIQLEKRPNTLIGTCKHTNRFVLAFGSIVGKPNEINEPKLAQLKLEENARAFVWLGKEGSTNFARQTEAVKYPDNPDGYDQWGIFAKRMDSDRKILENAAMQEMVLRMMRFDRGMINWIHDRFDAFASLGTYIDKCIKKATIIRWDYKLFEHGKQTKTYPEANRGMLNDLLTSSDDRASLCYGPNNRIDWSQTVARRYGDEIVVNSSFPDFEVLLAT